MELLFRPSQELCRRWCPDHFSRFASKQKSSCHPSSGVNFRQAILFGVFVSLIKFSNFQCAQLMTRPACNGCRWLWLEKMDKQLVSFSPGLQYIWLSLLISCVYRLYIHMYMHVPAYIYFTLLNQEAGRYHITLGKRPFHNINHHCFWCNFLRHNLILRRRWKEHCVFLMQHDEPKMDDMFITVLKP